MSLAFDTHAYVKKLKSVGFTDEQAEVQAETIAQIIDEKLSTKLDLAETERALRRDIKELETKVEREIKELNAKVEREIKELDLSFKRDMAELKVDIIKWVVGIAAAQGALIVARAKAPEIEAPLAPKRRHNTYHYDRSRDRWVIRYWDYSGKRR